jgi:putative ABC transport system permease protein
MRWARSHRSGGATATPSRGTARRAVARWAWRLFRREWRQQVLVLALLTAGVAASIGFSLAAYTTAPVPGNAEFGAANHFFRFGNTDRGVLEADVAAARDAFDTHEVIYHRRVPAAGLFEPVDYRAQMPDGPLGGPRLALVEGAHPAGDQVAITDGIAELFDARVGASLALDGVSRPVVGIVENPGSLADEFVLVPPSQTSEAVDVTILVDTSDDQARAFRVPSGAGLDIGSRPGSEGVTAAVTVLVLATVGLLLVALIAAASFVVIAHRRMRQLGMLAAIGATDKQLRLVTLTNGTLVGAVAAVIGAAVGFAGWAVAAPFVEDAVGYRIDQFDVPWWLIASGMLLAVLAGTVAAWWPARSVARVPTVRALSGRPPEPRPARGAAILAAVSMVTGVACLASAGDVADETTVTWTNAVLIVAGTVAVTVGVLLFCPLAIRMLAACVGRFPVAVRLAIGDLARYRARSGAALAAISLTLAIAVTVIVSASAAQAAPAEGNLPVNQVLIRAANVDGPFIPEAADLDRLRAGVDDVVEALDEARATSLDVVLDPASKPDPSFDGRQAITLVQRSDDGWMDVSLLYVATPQLLAHYRYDLAAVPPGAVVITRETGQFALLGQVQADRSAERSKVEPLTNVARLGPGYESLPGTFVTSDVLTRRGWMVAPSGRWLVETGAPPTTGQLAAAREAAADAGLTVEVRDRQGGLAALRSGATAAGTLTALGILAMTVGLVRSESGRDLRILAATGATRRTRRTLTAATAGGLAVLGAVLGIAGAYLGLTAGFARNLSALTPVPVMHLAVIAVGLPLAATLAGWLVSGRAVSPVTRQPME